MRLLRVTVILFFMLTQNAVYAQIPDWVQEEFTRLEGTWVTDNGAYMNDQETDDSYAIRWQWGAEKSNMTGLLYGMKDGHKTIEYWQFLQYYDYNEKAVKIIQVSSFGPVGEGYMRKMPDGTFEIDQFFTNPDGSGYRIAHTTTIFDDYDLTQSFNFPEENKKKLNRSYKWYLQ